MRLRATSRLYHRHNSEDEAGAGEHSSTIPPSLEQVRIPRQGTRAPHIRTTVRGAALTGTDLGLVVGYCSDRILDE